MRPAWHRGVTHDSRHREIVHDRKVPLCDKPVRQEKRSPKPSLRTSGPMSPDLVILSTDVPLQVAAMVDTRPDISERQTILSEFMKHIGFFAL